MRCATLVAAVVVAGWLAAPALAGDPAALLTQGKLDVDMGKPQAAAEAFEAVAADATAPAALRGEALVRLGLVQRDQGNLEGAAQTFERAWTEHARDKETLRLLVQAITGLVPGERWDEVWDSVVFRVDRGDAGRPVLRVQWPGVPLAPLHYTGEKVSLTFKDAPLKDVVRTLTDASGADTLVVSTRLDGTTTVRVRDTPWDQVLDIVLAPHGLVATVQGKNLTITEPGKAVAVPGARPSGVPGGSRRYVGQPIDVDFQDEDIQDVFRFFADVTRLNIVVHPGVRGKTTVKGRGLPWDEALDLVLAQNGFAAKHVGNLVEIGRPDRIGTRTHFEGKPIDVVFVRSDLLESLRRIAANGERTVSFGPGIAGKTTLKLSQVPWDQAFDIVVRVNGLAWKTEGTNIRVDRPAHLR